MRTRTNERPQDWTSDVTWVALYSIVIILLMVEWASKPA